MQLDLSNVINISVSEAPVGIGNYNTSNLALFTDETPGGTFPNTGYAIYKSPTQVGVDFGSNSKTYLMANAVFSQQPNILANSGYLVVIPLNPIATVTAVQHLSYRAEPVSGQYKLEYGTTKTAFIDFASSGDVNVQAALRAIPGLGAVTVTGGNGYDTPLVITFVGVTGAVAPLLVTDNTMQDVSGAFTPAITVVQAGAVQETLAAAITRTAGLVLYFGLMSTLIESQADMLAAAAVVQALNKIAFFVSRTAADVAPGGLLDLLRSGGFNKSRGIFYGTSTDANALVMQASYAGRALSTNFSGSNTTQTMHLKDLAGVQPDPTMTQTLLNQCLAAGADSYPSLQGVAKVFCSGANKFFDQVYNLGWFVGALEVAGFNFLAQSSTKIPQTEAGMDGLKGAYRDVCEQGITNQYGAPGAWKSSTLFGNTADLIANILQRGYYIFSTPISQQSQADRLARKAPLVQIAFKEAGAIHESDVIININA